MSEESNKPLRSHVRGVACVALVIGIVIGFFAKDLIFQFVGPAKNVLKTEGNGDYDIEELEVNYLQMLGGVKGVSFDVVNGVKCICKCDEAHPEGDSVFYRFQGYIGDDASKKVQKFRFDYVVKPIVADGQLSFSGGVVSRMLLEPEDVIVNSNGMKRLIEAFAVPQFKQFPLYAPNGAFAIKELYSNMAVIKVSKEK